MKDNYFIDTNIFIYSFDQQETVKRDIAKEMIKKALIDGKGFISSQVIQEFFNVATKKFESPLSVLEAKDFMENVFKLLNVVQPNFDFISKGLDVSVTRGYLFYDSLIIAAALGSGCKVLYSEDMQHGQMIQNLKIENPFLGYSVKKGKL